MLEITPLPALSDNYIWVLRAPDSPRVAVVDPGEAAPVQAFLQDNGYELAAILITHHHPDHVAGVEALAAEGIPVYGPAGENIPARTRALQGGDQIRLSDPAAEFDIIEVPGHTLGHIAYAGEGLLFSGDTLFSAGCGRLFEGTPEQMLASLSVLRRLADDTRIYCGHEYTLKNIEFARAVEPDNSDLQTRQQQAREQREANQPTLPVTLGEEKRINPFLRWDVESVRQAAAAHAGRTLESDAEVFAAIRAWKDSF